jgi:hypothetical protein
VNICEYMLYLTYDQLIWQDGLGAQLQRIFGLIAISMMYPNTEYVHRSLKNVEHASDQEISQIDSYFTILRTFQSVDHYQYQKIIRVHNLSPHKFQQCLREAQRYNLLLQVLLPYGLCEQNDQYYQLMIPPVQKSLSIKDLSLYSGQSLKIAIHLRRGDVSSEQHPERYISDVIYDQLIQQLVDRYRHLSKQAISVYIFTDADSLCDFQKWSTFPHLVILNHTQCDSLTTLNYLIHSDILIIAKSSFSYLAGLFHKGQQVYYFPFWHRPRPSWKPINEGHDPMI